MDESHRVRVQEVEEDWYVTFDHPMEKGHFFRFAAYVASERVLPGAAVPGAGRRVPHPRSYGRNGLYLCCSQDV